MFKHSLRILATLAIFACAATYTTVSFAFSANKDVDALKALDADWSKAAAAKNLEKAVSYYADDAVAYPPNEPVAVGKAAARKVWERYMAMAGFKISWQSNGAGADGNMGWTAGTYKLTVNGPDGKPMSEAGKYVCIYRKGADGKWLAIRDIWNSDSK